MSDEFHVDREALRDLTEHDDEEVALLAEVVYKHRYGEEP
jgi:hypothetical protein